MAEALGELAVKGPAARMRVLYEVRLLSMLWLHFSSLKWVCGAAGGQGPRRPQVRAS